MHMECRGLPTSVWPIRQQCVLAGCELFGERASLRISVCFPNCGDM